MTITDTTAPEMRALPLDAVIVPPDRLREVAEDRVQEMAVSMREVGQITPIEVAPADETGKFRLVAGAHRMAAARLAEKSTILAVIFDASAAMQRLREIDENLYRAELTPFDQAVFLGERRRIYEKMHGVVRAGRPKKIGPNRDQLSFFDDTTQKFGLSQKIIKSALSRYFGLEDQLSALRRVGGALSGAQLDRLAKLGASERRVVMKLLAEGRTPAVALGAVRAPVTEPETPMERAKRLFLALTAEERGEFLTWAKRAGGTR